MVPAELEYEGDEGITLFLIVWGKISEYGTLQGGCPTCRDFFISLNFKNQFGNSLLEEIHSSIVKFSRPEVFFYPNFCCDFS